jgi:hypothetical protein
VAHHAVAAAIEPAAPRQGETLVARAAGYLDRRQAHGAPVVFLWPGDAGYIQDLAYWEFSDDSLRTVRWESGFTVSLDADLATDPVLVAKVEEVVAEVRRVTGLPVTAGAGGAVTIGIDPDILEDEDAVAIAENTYRGAVIVGSRLRFARRAEISGGPLADYGNTLLHEMGHVIGLRHSPDDKDVMTPGAGRGTRVAEYQPNEASCLHMLYAHRRAGNRFPDTDPGVSGAALSSPRETRIVDRRPARAQR